MNYTKVKLTNRLQLVYDMAPKIARVADIGTDHGYLPVALILGGKATTAIAGDVNEGPLNAASKYVCRMGLNEKINCRLGNGLQVLEKDEVDAVTICGMGGFLMAQLLQESPFKPQNLVLQPQNGRQELREVLLELGYVIKDEALVEDMGHIYDVWVCKLEEANGDVVYSNLAKDDIRWEIGAHVCNKRDSLLPNLLDRLIKIEKNIINSMMKSTNENPKLNGHKERLKKLEDCYAKYC